MDNYVDIRIPPNPEFATTVLMNTVFARFHQALAGDNTGRIGVSFPNHSITLGDRLRIHGKETDLERLYGMARLESLSDYIQLAEVLPIPNKVCFRTVSRVQAKSVTNKRKRSIAKGWLNEEEAKRLIPEGQEERLALPYAQIRSTSTQSIMRIYVKHGDLVDTPSPGKFSNYGLSKVATIPWF